MSRFIFFAHHVFIIVAPIQKSRIAHIKTRDDVTSLLGNVWDTDRIVLLY
jgi:hypothetical protein